MKSQTQPLKKSRTVLVTGATSGIGYATAELLLKQGFTVWACGRRAERLKPLKKEFPRTCLIGALDVCSKNSVSTFFKKFDPKKIDILINNAGLALGTERTHNGNFADWETMIRTNLLGLLRVTHEVLPHLAEKPGSHIVNLGSVAGKWVYPGGAVYCATKAAVRFLSEGIRMDLLGRGVRVTNIEPGMVETEFSVVRMGSQEKAKSVYSGMTPLTAHDIAESIVWCIERPPHVNISELTIFPTDQAGVGPHLVSRHETKRSP